MQQTEVRFPETTDELLPELSKGEEYMTVSDAFYAYSFGAITFLELLDILERLLNIQQTN